MKKIIEKLKQLDKGTICRTILQIGAYANQIIAIFGQESFANDTWYQIISLVVTIIVTGVSYWYNNDWSNGALLVRDIFDMLQDGTITKEEIKEFIKKHKKDN